MSIMSKIFKICPKSGRIVKIRLTAWWAVLAFPVIGIAALLWFLIRVVPKPSRLSYPCQKIAMPIAVSFFVWLAGITGAVMFYKKAKEFIRERRYLLVVFSTAAFMICGLWSYRSELYPLVFRTGANQPVGTARGIFPGRVVWAFDTNATAWQTTAGRWYQDAYNDQSAVDRMVSRSIRDLSGTTNDADAWNALFRSFNSRKGLGSRGYAAGEKIAIKINGNNDVTAASIYTDGASINASPQLTLALLKSLINGAGIPQSNISVAEPSRVIKDNIFIKCTNLFPNVKYVDQFGTSGRTRAAYASNAIPFSKSPGNNIKHIATCFTEADYVINMAILKGHGGQGVTLCGKNWFGATAINWDYMVNTNEKYNFNAPTNGANSYMRFVDFMGHKDLGGKTVLFMIDALYAHNSVGGQPRYKWQMPPFNNDWPSSIFVSEDGVAIDSVGVDFLTSEFPTMPDLNYCDYYLLEAAQADNPPSGTFYDPEKDGSRLGSLGTFEHWNNAAAKMYSRNLSATGTGIELVRTFQNPPSVSIAAPISGSVMSAPGACTITANAADSDGMVLKVLFFTNGVKAGEDITAGDGFTCGLTNLSAGTYTMTARALDSDGAATTSYAVTVTVTSATALPDLRISRVYWSPANPGPGTNVTFGAVVSNAGTAASLLTNHSVVFRINGAGLSYGAPKTSLAPGAVQSIDGLYAWAGSPAGMWTAVAGTHTVTAFADDVNRVAESDEKNNSNTVQIIIDAALPPSAGVPAAGLLLWLEADSLSATHGSGDAVSVWKAAMGPDAVRCTAALPNAKAPTAPTFTADAMNGKPAIRFDGADNQMTISGGITTKLAGKPFSIFMVSKSASASFGFTGNSANGSGGVPRLYIERQGTYYSELSSYASLPTKASAVELAYSQHDGISTLSGFLNGVRSPDVNAPLTAAFAGTGDMSIPFWPGNVPQAGDISAILIYERKLSDAERISVENYLITKYSIGTAVPPPPPSSGSNVILIGDSIRMGYQPYVGSLLSKLAPVSGPAENCQHSGMVTQYLKTWVIDKKPALVHMNAGLHDLIESKVTGAFQIPTNRYAANLDYIFRTLRDNNIKVVWSTTTPVVDAWYSNWNLAQTFIRHDADVVMYNSVARAVLERYNIPVLDLYAYVKAQDPNAVYYTDGVHYSSAGYAKLAAQISVFISNNLSTAAAPVPALCDLVISSISWNPQNPGPGTNVTMIALVSNAGTAASMFTNHAVVFKVDGAALSYAAPRTNMAPGATLRVTGSSQWLTSVTNAWTAVAGTHTVFAWVDDINRIPEANENNNSNTAALTVVEPAVSGDIYLEAEAGTLTAPLAKYTDDAAASGGTYIMVAPGNNLIAAAPANGAAVYTFTVPTSGLYRISGLTKASNGNDDSFWVKMDSGTWVKWNDIYYAAPAAVRGLWNWVDVYNSDTGNSVMEYDLPAGTHTLTVAYREDGAKLDRLLIHKTGASSVPSTAAAMAATTPSLAVSPSPLQFYPKPEFRPVPSITASASVDAVKNRLDMQFTVNMNGVELYEIWYAVSEAGKDAWQTISPDAVTGGVFSLTSLTGDNAWQVRGLTLGQNYDLRVTAVADQGAGMPYIIRNIETGRLFSEQLRPDTAAVLNNPYRGGSEGMTFVNLPAGSTVKIYTVAGAQVASLGSGNDGSGRIVWNVLRDDGQKVKPGIYLCRISSPAGNKLVKVIVQR